MHWRAIALTPMTERERRRPCNDMWRAFRVRMNGNFKTWSVSVCSVSKTAAYSHRPRCNRKQSMKGACESG